MLNEKFIIFRFFDFHVWTKTGSNPTYLLNPDLDPTKIPGSATWFHALSNKKKKYMFKKLLTSKLYQEANLTTLISTCLQHSIKSF